ncbi:MAG: choice-of-anchor I family protein [Steroidobacteraceae bacterium]
MRTTKFAAPLAVLASLVQAAPAAQPAKQPKLRLLGTHESGLFNVGGAEVPTYDPITRRAFVVNAGSATVDVLDLRNPRQPALVGSIDIVADLAPRSVGAANSVDARFGILVVAVEAEPKQDDGYVAFYSTLTLGLLGVAPAGALPDMLTFSDNGRYVLVANEGEPDTTYTNDPEGTVTIIDLLRIGQPDFARTVRFDDFNAGGPRHAELPADVRVYGPNATVAQDLEPEYITTDGETAWVTLQENNAIAVIDIRTARVKKVFALGFKDHSKARNKLDASDDDGEIDIARWPVFGMYQPDAVAQFTSGGRRYLITANEGDTRDYEGFAEEARVGDLTLDAGAFPDAAELQKDENLGRLTVTTALGDTDDDGDLDRLFVPGGRSFSIWNAATGALVFDSGAELEQLLANLLPDDFNANHEENGSFDNRSDNKGPEPEGVTLGKVQGKLYAFVGLERIGGILVLDLSDPRNPEFVDYLNNRRFRDAGGQPIPTCAEFDPPDSDDIEDCVRPNPAAGDLGPEGLEFVPAAQAPRGKPLLIVGNEVSGTTTVYEFR